MTVLPFPVGGSREVAPLLEAARAELGRAALAATATERYVAAHLAALRAAAAVLAAWARPATSRKRPVSVWVLLGRIAPDLEEWAYFFASGARKRADAEAGLASAVTAREADDLLRDAERFLAVVEAKLGAHAQTALPLGGGRWAESRGSPLAGGPSPT